MYTDITAQNYVDAIRVSYTLSDLETYLSKSPSTYGFSDVGSVKDYVKNLPLSNADWLKDEQVQGWLKDAWHMCNQPRALLSLGI